jgi:cytochrome P450
MPSCDPTVIRGAAAAWWCVKLFRDPLTCVSKAYHRHGPLTVLRPVQRRKYLLAIGPKLNREILSEGKTLRPVSHTWRGPVDSAQRRLHYGMTRMTGEKHRQQRRLMQPLLRQR